MINRFLIALSFILSPQIGLPQSLDHSNLCFLNKPVFSDSGELLPLRSYAQTIERSMSFLAQSDRWVVVDPKTLTDENGVNHPPYFYYSFFLNDDGTQRKNSYLQKSGKNAITGRELAIPVDPKTQKVIEEYTSSAIYGVMLFEEIDKINRQSTFRKNRQRAFDWIMNNPVKPFFLTVFMRMLVPIPLTERTGTAPILSNTCWPIMPKI